MKRFLWEVDLCLLFSNVYSDQTKVTLSSNTRRVEFSNSFLKNKRVYIREDVDLWKVSVIQSMKYLYPKTFSNVDNTPVVGTK